MQLSRSEIEEQAHRMREFYSTSDEKPDVSIYLEDEIAEVLNCRDILLHYVNQLLESGATPCLDYLKRLQQNLAAMLDKRMPPDMLNMKKLNERLESLLNKAGFRYEDWIDQEGNQTQLYLEAQKRYDFRQLRILKSEMFKLWNNRNCELEDLHLHTSGPIGMPCL
jgi:hypothetical protein